MQVCLGVNHETQQDVRDVLARMVRIEGALAALVVSQTQAAAAQQTQHEMIDALRLTVQDVVQMQRDTQDTLIVVVQSQRDVLASVNSDSVGGSPSLRSLSSNSSDHSICSFSGCMLNTAAKSCSAGKSLRHMQVCTSCPTNACRYLAIAEHMMMFQQAPRVTETDVCCWCGVPFELDANPDARSRHRTKCHTAAILALKNPFLKDHMIQVLSTAWSPLNIASPSKRDREGADTGSMFIPPQTPAAVSFTASDLPPFIDDDQCLGALSGCDDEDDE